MQIGVFIKKFDILKYILWTSMLKIWLKVFQCLISVE